jgi:3-oxoacyl-[acyl-carrier-protein] synthase-3
LAFDINLACSGYVYGLSTAYAYAQNEGVNRVLLLVGETMSKIVSRYDKVNTPLFGDAGTATLIEKGEQFGQSIFSLHTDGKGAEVMMIPDGGFRNPVSADSFVEETDANGDKRSRLQFRMDGMAVFNFGMSEEPRDVKNLVEAAGLELGQVDLLIYHQANKFMTDFFSKWLKFDKAKTPYSIRKYGNTSSASIPLTIVSELYEAYPERKNVILSGFGAGLSWGSVLLDLKKCKISKVIEY